MKQNKMTADQIRKLELSGIWLTGLAKFLLMDILDQKLIFISSTILIWLSYIIYKKRTSEKALIEWGLNTKRFKATLKELLPIAFILILAFLFIGNWRGTLILNWHILPILLIYPIWGIIQQFLIIGIMAGNMKKIERWDWPEGLIILLTAILFGIVHYPFPYLIIGTFFLALVYTYLYFKGRNLIVMGIFHGWLGACFYFFVLGRDPLEEVFRMLN